MLKIAATKLSQIICTRISHDLIGNIGAVSNAVELLEEGDMDFMDDIKSNSAYVLDDGKGGAVLSTVSKESIFVHESTHALDHAQGKDLKKTHNSEYGTKIPETESRAVAEGNKYREAATPPEAHFFLKP